MQHMAWCCQVIQMARNWTECKIINCKKVETANKAVVKHWNLPQNRPERQNRQLEESSFNCYIPEQIWNSYPEAGTYLWHSCKCHYLAFIVELNERLLQYSISWCSPLTCLVTKAAPIHFIDGKCHTNQLKTCITHLTGYHGFISY